MITFIVWGHCTWQYNSDFGTCNFNMSFLYGLKINMIAPELLAIWPLMSDILTSSDNKWYGIIGCKSNLNG